MKVEVINMNSKLFKECQAFLERRVRKLTMDKSGIQIALDNYKRDYAKTLKQYMKLYGLDGEFGFNPKISSPYFGHSTARTGSLVLIETRDMYAPYTLQFISTKKNSYGRPEFVYEFESRNIEYIKSLFTEDILPCVVKGECAA